MIKRVIEILAVFVILAACAAGVAWWIGRGIAKEQDRFEELSRESRLIEQATTTTTETDSGRSVGDR